MNNVCKFHSFKAHTHGTRKRRNLVYVCEHCGAKKSHNVK